MPEVERQEEPVGKLQARVPGTQVPRKQPEKEEVDFEGGFGDQIGIREEDELAIPVIEYQH
jgi:hypothetical protein